MSRSRIGQKVSAAGGGSRMQVAAFQAWGDTFCCSTSCLRLALLHGSSSAHRSCAALSMHVYRVPASKLRNFQLRASAPGLRRLAAAPG